MSRDESNLTAAEQQSRDAYRDHMSQVYREEFGITDPQVATSVADEWFYCDERHDFHLTELRRRTGGSPRVLDLASGLGSALVRGLQQGINGFGVEPDSEKLRLMNERIGAGISEAGWPSTCKGRFVRSVGETLPFRDHSFDVVLSYQTLEHVQDTGAVLTEMLRVVRPGGALHLRCPDYSGTFEGHYRLPWLPLFPRPLARAWLRLQGRPTLGFEGIRYTTRRRLLRILREISERTGTPVRVIDLERERYRERLHEKGLPGWQGPAWLWRALYFLRRMFREELQVNLWVEVGP